MDLCVSPLVMELKRFIEIVSSHEPCDTLGEYAP